MKEIPARVRRRQQRRLLKYLLAIGSIVIGGFALWGVFFSPLFLIKNVGVQGAETVPEGEIIKLAEESIRGKILFVLPKNHLFFLDEKLLIVTIQNRYWRLSEITPIYSYRNGDLTLRVKERRPIAQWCVRGEGLCLFVDEKGILFEPVPEYEGDTVLKIFDETGRSLRPGSRGIEQEAMPFLAFARERLQPTVKIISITLEKESIDAQYVKLHTDQQWYILADTTMQIGEVAGSLRLLLAKEIGDRANRLEYIDLRVPNRAYYKLR